MAMNRTLIALVAALLGAPANADTLIHNANGIQIGADGKLHRFESLLIGDDGKVVQTLTAVQNPHAPNAARIDAQGRTLLPGLIDAHGHVMALGLGAVQLDVTGPGSLGELQSRLKLYAAQHPGSGWGIGRGCNQELLPNKSFPTARTRLGRGDRPVSLERVDGHAVVVNSAASSPRAHRATKDPVGGKIERERAAIR